MTRDERFLLKIASHGAEIGKETVAVIICMRESILGVKR